MIQVSVLLPVINEFRPRQFQSVSAEPRLKNTALFCRYPQAFDDLTLGLLQAFEESADSAVCVDSSLHISVFT